MKYILLENQGEIVPEALFLMGASTKRDNEDLIGFFGSGNKYALALMLRLNIPFRIFSGDNEIKITTRHIDMRGTELDVIQVNGVDTSLTIQMGPQWEPWFILRELYCNAIDEGGAIACLDIDELSIRPAVGKTRIYVGITEEIQKVVERWDTYFCFERGDELFSSEVASAGKVTVYPNRTQDGHIAVYRKGVLVYESDVKAAYSYDLQKIEIDEMRLLRRLGNFFDYAAIAWYKCENVNLIQDLLNRLTVGAASNSATSMEFTESSFDWGYYGHYIGGAWREAIGNRIVVNRDMAGHYLEKIGPNSLILPASLCRCLTNKFADVIVYGVESNHPKKTFEVTETLEPKVSYKLKKAVEAFSELNMSINYPIEVVDFTDPSVLGKAEDGKILLSRIHINEASHRDIILTILEEQVHLETNLGDGTRGLQNYLFSKWLSVMEDKNAIFF